MSKRMCYFCNKHEATIRDYRTFNDITSAYISCEFCRSLDNSVIRIIQEKKQDPLIYIGFDVKGMSSEDLTRLENILSVRIENQIQDQKVLVDLLELNREATLRENK